MEKWPNRPITPKEEYEAGNLSFELVEARSLAASDIRADDRAFIHTSSGNRYMLRHSRSRNGQLVIYNEREGGFSAESARPFLVKRGAPAIAEVGRPLQYFAITDEQTGAGIAATSTTVNRIEIRRNLERAVQSGAEGRGPSGAFREIARSIISEATPAQRRRQ